MLFISGCYNIPKLLNKQEKELTFPVNKIIQDIPKYNNGQFFAYYIFTKQKQKQLELSIPENGYDSLMLRMWFSYPSSLNQFAELVELKIDSNGICSGKYIKMRNYFNPKILYEKIKIHADTIVNPLCGWPCLMDSLNRLEIIKLHTIESLPKYKKTNKNDIGFDNDYLTLSVEVSTENEYRFYQYNNFEGFKNIDEVSRLYRFILFLREQLCMVENDPYWYGK